MPERRTDPFAFEQMLSWLKPNAQLGATAERAIETFGQVGQLLSETAQAVVKKQTEIMSESMSTMTAGMQDLPRLRTPQDVMNAQAAALRTGMEAAVNNMRDMTEIWQRCSAGIADLWLQALASNGQTGSQDSAPAPMRKAAE